MKRFFRTSKFGVDPLPPPQPAQPEPPQLQQQLQGLAVVEAKHPKSSFVPGEQLESKMRFSNHPKGGSGGGTTGSVTPFPIEIGREQPAPQMKGKEKNTARSLMEIQQLQGQSDVSRRDEWVQTQRKPERGPRPAQTEMIIGGAPDDWSGKNERSKASDGHDPPLFLPPAPNLHNVAPMANHSLINGSTPTPSQPALFLPPGARPSSSPTALRPGTPTRPSYTESLGHSQSSILTSPGPGPPLEPYPPSSMTGSRDRGYSSASASARESDLDSSAHGHVSAPVPLSNGKHPKQSFPPAPVRSPLANSYEFPGVSNPILPLPKSASPLQPLPTTNTQPFNDLKEVKLSIGPDGRDDDGDTPKAMERDKKKFWGMGRKDKTKDRRDSAVPNRSYEDARQSAEFWRNDGVALSSLVQGEDEYRGEHRGRLQQGYRPLRQEDSVTTAINLLCGLPDPPGANIFDVVDRINHSASPDSVSKEAAQAIRKQIKHGNESERRAAAKVWSIMMRNVSAKAFRVHASSKKFMACLEILLLAPPMRPYISAATCRTMTDILADLTYMYGTETGCEGLLELWIKVKKPQQPDHGVPLPEDHQIYVPQPTYANGFSSYASEPPSLAGSRRPSPPSLQNVPLDDRSFLPPMPLPMPSPRHFGPGYAQLPDHGEDMRRLGNECIAAKESARVLSEALVFTRPDELESKPIIGEFHRKCLLAQESLTNQIEWAQAEAAQSRERVIMMSADHLHHEDTSEERALAMLFEAHGMLAEALKSNDDLERMARDDMQMREVRERSKKDLRMDRNHPGMLIGGNGQLLPPDNQQQGSSSRSPSPHNRVPRVVDSPHQADFTAPSVTQITRKLIDRSRTPSPDKRALLHASVPPGRAPSPLGRNMRVPRPLPNPFSRGNGSQQSLGSTPNPSRSGTGSTVDHADDEDVHALAKPSRKALGKRRAVVDEDNTFDPDDMFGKKNESSGSSEESAIPDAASISKPVSYAYDAYQEKLDSEGTGGSCSGGGSGPRPRARARSRNPSVAVQGTA